MADKDRTGSSTRSGGATPNRDKGRKAPIIDGTATDVTPVAATPARVDADEQAIAAGPLPGNAAPGSAEEAMAETLAGGHGESVHSEPTPADAAAPLPEPAPASHEAAAEAPSVAPDVEAAVAASAATIAPEPETATPPADAPEPVHAAPDPALPPPPAKASRGLPLAALAVSILALLMAAGLGLRPNGASDAAALQARLDDLQQKVAALDTRTQDLAALGDRFKALDAASKANASGLDAVRADVRKALDAATAARPTAQASPVPAAAAPAAAPPPPPVDLGPLTARVASLEAQVQTVGQQAAKTGELATGLAALDQRVAADQKRLDAISAQPKLDVAATEQKTQSAFTAANSAASVVMAQALASKVQAGQPFDAELSALAASGADKAKVAVLQPAAAKGVPTAASLADAFAPLAGPVLAGSDPGASGGILDRLMRSASRLVRMRPAGDSTGTDPASLVARIEASLARGNVADALAARDLLPGPAKTITDDWAARARLRADAMAAARALEAEATQRLGQQRS